MRLLFLYVCLLSVTTSFAQPWLSRETDQETDSISLFFVGDVMQHSPQIKGAWNEISKDYDYLPCFQYISPYWRQADFVFANLETTLTDRDYSGYPQFCAPWQLARDLKKSGVNILTTNNNHSCDKGYQGICKTIHYLDSLKILHTGTFTDTTNWISQTPIILRHGKFKIAVLSYTYGTNEIPVTHGQVVSMIDTLHIARNIEKARLDTATNIIAIMHWGEEYQTQANAKQRKLAAWLHENGVDIVIGSHPHVIQPLEYTIDGKDTTGVTVYSMGNFVSNQSQRYTNGGIGIRLTLSRQNQKTSYRMEYLSNYVYRPIEEGLRRYYVIPEPQAADVLREKDITLYRQFFQDTDSIINQAAEKIK